MTSKSPKSSGPMGRTTTRRFDVAGIGEAEVTFSEWGEGHPFLLLHGGGGPQTVTAFAGSLAGAKEAHAVVPVHPGFGGTPRPEGLSSVAGLASVYAALLDELDLSGVTVVGNSIGAWTAAELALTGSPRLSSVVLVDGVGITVPGHPVADFFSLTMAEVADLSYYEPDKFRIDPSSLPVEAQAAMASNRAALAVYAGRAMTDPTLAHRLAQVRVPVLVIWGEADRIADREYGRALASAIPGASFQLLERTGHLPQLESPERLLPALWEFAGAHRGATSTKSS